MKKILLLLLMGIFLTTGAFAVTNKRYYPRPIHTKSPDTNWIILLDDTATLGVPADEGLWYDLGVPQSDCFYSLTISGTVATSIPITQVIIEGASGGTNYTTRQTYTMTAGDISNQFADFKHSTGTPQTVLPMIRMRGNLVSLGGSPTSTTATLKARCGGN